MRRFLLLGLFFLPLTLTGQEVLTLDECRSMAVENSRELSIKRTEVELAGYDRKIARANYFPSISVTGAYYWNEKPFQLISDKRMDVLSNGGTYIQDGINDWASMVQDKIKSRPDLFSEYIASPLWQEFMNRISDLGIAEPINEIGESVAKEMIIDMRDVYVGMVSLNQPVFAGGKIVLANKAARLAEELAKEQYGIQYSDLIVDVDAAYWQIVSIAGKKRLAEAYSDLIHSVQRDVRIAVEAGVATPSDSLSVRVKASEAEMMLNKATNGLSLAKMLLCKRIGLPLDSSILLEDETEMISPQSEKLASKDMEDVFYDRPETRSLALAGEIYDAKAGMARADMLPQVGLNANYLVTNPNLYHGFQKKFGGAFSVGVMIQIPIFHGFEALNKYRKAKAEASIYRERYEDAREMITLQVSQCSDACAEALNRVELASDYLDSTEENLRVATSGFEAGTIDTQTLLAAQTAWLQAGTEAIDASVELRLATSNLLRAQGEIKPGGLNVKHKNERSFRLVQYNVGALSKYGEGSSAKKVGYIIRSLNADVVSLNEVDSCNIRNNTYQCADLAAELGGWDYTFARALTFGGGAYGNGILSREKMFPGQMIPLEQGAGSESRSAAVCETPRCVFVSTHLDYKSEEAALRQVETLTKEIRSRYAHSKKPVFLAGDMNALPDSPVIEALKADWELISVSEPTYPCPDARKQIDYVFVLKGSKKVKVVDTFVARSLPLSNVEAASDHYPVIVDVSF